MDILKVGRDHLFANQIEDIVTPATQGNHTDAALVRYVSGRQEHFYGDDAEAIRTWLSKQLETVPPTGPVVQTKAPTPKR